MKEPDNLMSRPHFRGLPVPYNVVWNGSTPDFKTLDTVAHAKALRERLCSLCGQKMGRKVCFIGGPGSAASHLYRDGPMHVECARYAFEVCPFLGGKDYSKTGKEAVSIVSNVRPKKMALYITTSYIPIKGVLETLILAGSPLEIIWM